MVLFCGCGGRYATAVFISYINAKLAKGRSRFEVSNKLMELERGVSHPSSSHSSSTSSPNVQHAPQLPQFARSFHEARARTGLPASPIFPPLRDTPSSPTSSTTSRPGIASRPSNNATIMQGPRVGTISRSGVETIRPGSITAGASGTGASRTGNPEDGSGELPPPPYSREDPEPEMTQVLARQLSQLDESNRGGGGVGLERVGSSASGVNVNGNNRQQGQSGRPSVESTRRASPAAGNGNGNGNRNSNNLSPAEREQLDLERAIEASRRESHAGPSDLGPAISTRTETARESSSSMSDSMHGMGESERREYQQAVEESRRLASGGAGARAAFTQAGLSGSSSGGDDGLTAQERSELREVMEESKRQAEEDERRRREKEEAERSRAGPSSIPMPGGWNDFQGSGYSNNNPQAGASNPAFLSRRESNPSFSNTPAPLPSLFLPGHEGENSPQGRHRRATSDYKRPDSLVGGMGGLNLLDEQDEVGALGDRGATSVGMGMGVGQGKGLVEPLKPTPTGMGTGVNAGSRNPFLDPGTPVREAGSSSPGPSPVSASGRSRNPFASSEEPEEGSGRMMYAPPPGPPPGHPSLQQQATGQSISRQAGHNASSPYQAPSFPPRSPQTPLTPSHTNNPFLQPRSHSPQPPQPPPKPVGPSPSSSQQPPQEYVTGSGRMGAAPILPARPAPGQRGDLARQTSLRKGEVDPLEVLRRFDTIILVDDSGSMAGG